MKVKQMGCWLMLSALVACSHLPNGKKNEAKANKSRQATKVIAGETLPTLTSSLYRQHQATQGLVLMTINWGTKWRCSDFDKATLQSIRLFPKDGWLVELTTASVGLGCALTQTINE